MKPAQKLHDPDQSIWLDNITRELFGRLIRLPGGAPAKNRTWARGLGNALAAA